jgi:hypothetical protein
MFRAVRARAALSAATAGYCRDAVLVAGAQVHDLGAVLDRQGDGCSQVATGTSKPSRRSAPLMPAARAGHGISWLNGNTAVKSIRQAHGRRGESDHQRAAVPILVAFGRPVYRACGWSPLEA